MKRISFLGLGTMGAGIAQNLLKAGYPLTIWNRTQEKCLPLIANGAQKAESVEEAVKDADIIMYCLSDDNAVNDLVFGDNGLVNYVKAGQIVIDMSTVHPDLSLKEGKAFSELDVEFLDAPVFGSRNEAANAGLWIVVGGKPDIYEIIKPVLEAVSETTHYMGKTSYGTSMKLVGNLIVAFQLEALGEALIMATKAGLNIKDVLGVLHVTDFKSPIFDGVGASLCTRDFSPNFALKLMLKDANLIAKFAQDMNTPIPALAAIRENIKSAVNQGWGEENASALIKALELQSGISI